jgi:ELP3 family radical SAM enzyme/protein acetyltransferase
MESIEQITDIENTATTHHIENEHKLKNYVKDLIQQVGKPDINTNIAEIEQVIKKLRIKYRIIPSKAKLLFIYEHHFGATPINHTLGRFMIKKACRSRSGVLVSTVVLRPDVFSCPKKCSYCPTETDLDGKRTQPKSYLSSEPAMLRALKYNFDIRGQICDRINTYIRTGNIQINSGSCKMEIILSGGTWESYPYDYRKLVMNEIYWAANTYEETITREILPIEEEIHINETAKYRIIGMTLETRPDFVTKQSIKDYRRWGVTRIQIGVQHYNDDILDGINRDCHTVDTIRAIKLLKQTGFKVVCHLMPDLPGSSPELDKWMFEQAITNPDLQFDDVKVYPCAVCKSSDPNLLVNSDIADWYKDGTYVPYAEKDINKLIEVLKYYKKNIQPWVRIQRMVRDIPKPSIEVGYEGKSNLRQIIQDQMKKEGTKCNCIRCMEIGDNDQLVDSARVVVRSYLASEGQEYHISIESNTIATVCSYDWWNYKWFCVMYYLTLIFTGRKTWWEGNIKTYNGVVGFCRLRLDSNPGAGFIKELESCALIREVHVYGHSLGVGNSGTSSQHKGFGQLLVNTAEEIIIQNGFTKSAVIAGVGTREYYKNKCGYHLEGTYMNKYLVKKMEKYRENKKNIFLFWTGIFIMIGISCILHVIIKFNLFV